MVRAFLRLCALSASLLCVVTLPSAVGADGKPIATQAAEAYALTRQGIAILIHVGDDIPNAHFATGDAFGAALAGKIRAEFDIEARAFVRPNDGTPATVISYHIGHLVHGMDNGTEIKDVQSAIDAMPDVVAQFRLLQELGPVLARD